MLRHEIGVLAQPIAGTLDLNDDGMVKQPVEQCGCDDGITDDFMMPSSSIACCVVRGYAEFRSVHP